MDWATKKGTAMRTRSGEAQSVEGSVGMTSKVVGMSSCVWEAFSAEWMIVLSRSVLSELEE